MNDINDAIKERDNMIELEKEFIRAWYDPVERGYRFYTPSGDEIKPSLKGSITIEDNWGGYKYHFHSAQINVLVKIVNDKP